MDAIPATAKTLQLPDGRTLGYAAYGAAAGKPLFYFHGHSGSRFEAKFLAEQATQAGVRLIGVDRPGLGLSSFQPQRRLRDWPEDVSALADSLHLDHFAVVGFSGGGPAQIPQRLTACGLVAGVGHIHPFLAFLSQWLPWLLLPLLRAAFQTEAQAQKTLANAARHWVAPDQNSLRQPGIKELMAASLVEALHPGAQGAAYDGAVLGRPWGFNLAAIKFPKLYLWHGELANEVPVASGRALAAHLPQCQPTYYPNEGHISLIVNHAPDIVQALC